jgi:hypothetical protein
MALDPTRYFLFPYTVLSERDYRHLAILLPQLSVLQVIRPPAVPGWLGEQVAGWPVITEKNHLETIKVCLKGYQEFARLHGENSVLASLSLDQISRDFAESRFRIQTELKKNDSGNPDPSKLSLLEAAIFLEMARDLDEKEIELETGLARIDTLEGEFREILGISDEEEFADTIETLNPPLTSEKAYLSFMLPKRIESWFRLLSNRTPKGCPALVTTAEPALQELLDLFRGEFDRAGKTLEPACLALGSMPSLADFAIEDFLSLLSDPEASRLLASYWHCLDRTLVSPHDLTRREQLTLAVDALQDYLHDYRDEIGLSGSTPLRADLVFANEIRWSTMGKYLDRLGGWEQGRENADADDVIKILVCRT